MDCHKEGRDGEAVRHAAGDAASLDAFQIHGGYGFMKEYRVNRFFREAKMLEIGEGTNEIQQLLIAEALGC